MAKKMSHSGIADFQLPVKTIENLVIYQDNHLIALNKPSGLLTQPAKGGKDNLEDRGKKYIKELMKKPGNVFLHPVHRLDRSVSGIVLFARTGKALSRLNADMRERKVSKIYHAVTSPGPSVDRGVLEHYLKHSTYHAIVVKDTAPGAKKAVLEYKKLKTFKDSSLLEIKLVTGRYHQIRVQLAAVGCPIVGDSKYAGHYPYKEQYIFLHHRRMELIHPVTKKTLILEADYPDFWQSFKRS